MKIPTIILAILLAALLLVSGIAFNRKSELVPTTFYFMNSLLDPDFTQPLPTERLIAPTDRTPDMVMRLLLAGPTTEESERGFITTFTGTQGQASGPMLGYYKGITVADGVAVVDFSEPAFAYLNGAAAMQMSVKEPIERTLRQFSEIREIQYSRDGVVFDEWDA